MGTLLLTTVLSQHYEEMCARERAICSQDRFLWLCKKSCVPIMFGSIVAFRVFDRGMGGSRQCGNWLEGGNTREGTQPWQTARSVKRSGRRATVHSGVQALALFRRAMCSSRSSRSAMPIRYQQII